MTQSAGFLVRKELNRLVQQLEDVQKMGHGVELTSSVQVLNSLSTKHHEVDARGGGGGGGVLNLLWGL